MAPDFNNTTAEKDESHITVVKMAPAFAFRPPLNNYYTQALARQAGTPVVSICPDKDGKLSKPVALVESSGDPALDAAAVRWATDARYKPRKSPLDGKPYVSCDKLRVNFAGQH